MNTNKVKKKTEIKQKIIIILYGAIYRLSKKKKEKFKKHSKIIQKKELTKN